METELKNELDPSTNGNDPEQSTDSHTEAGNVGETLKPENGCLGAHQTQTVSAEGGTFEHVTAPKRGTYQPLKKWQKDWLGRLLAEGMEPQDAIFKVRDEANWPPEHLPKPENAESRSFDAHDEPNKVDPSKNGNDPEKSADSQTEAGDVGEPLKTENDCVGAEQADGTPGTQSVSAEAGAFKDVTAPKHGTYQPLKKWQKDWLGRLLVEGLEPEAALLKVRDEANCPPEHLPKPEGAVSHNLNADDESNSPESVKAKSEAPKPATAPRESTMSRRSLRPPPLKNWQKIWLGRLVDRGMSVSDALVKVRAAADRPTGSHLDANSGGKQKKPANQPGQQCIGRKSDLPPLRHLSSNQTHKFKYWLCEGLSRDEALKKALEPLPIVPCPVIEARDPQSLPPPSDVSSKKPRNTDLVFIVPNGYPDKILSSEQLDTIERRLLDAILEIDGEKEKPGFKDTRRSEGRLVMTCMNEYSMTWLLEYFETKQPLDGVLLETLNPSKRIKAIAVLPPCGSEDNPKAFTFLGKQNKGLKVALWEVLKRVDSEKDTRMDLEIDGESAQVLEKCSTVCYKLGSGEITVASKRCVDVGVQTPRALLANIKNQKPTRIMNPPCYIHLNDPNGAVFTSPNTRSMFTQTTTPLKAHVSLSGPYENDEPRLNQIATERSNFGMCFKSSKQPQQQSQPRKRNSREYFQPKPKRHTHWVNRPEQWGYQREQEWDYQPSLEYHGGPSSSWRQFNNY